MKRTPQTAPPGAKPVRRLWPFAYSVENGKVLRTLPVKQPPRPALPDALF